MVESRCALFSLARRSPLTPSVEQVCLFGPPVLSLRPLLRAEPPSPSTDEHLMQQIGAAVWGKKFAHNGLGGPDGIARDGKMGSMVGIGG